MLEAQNQLRAHDLIRMASIEYKVVFIMRECVRSNSTMLKKYYYTTQNYR
jgi:hypothetical protein